MPDIEKVIKGIKCCINTTTENLDSNPNACIECPYAENGNACSPWALLDDVLELLKEYQQIVLCKDCKYGKRLGHFYECDDGVMHEQDFYCKAGERKEE